MRANHLVDIQELQDSTDYDNENAIWNTVAQTFAEIIPLRGKELVDAQQVHAEITHKIKISWQADIRAEHRLRWESRNFYPLAPPINKKEKNRWLELMCVERK